MNHEVWCHQKALPHEDAAKRLSDEYNLHRIAAPYDSIGKWFAVSLAEGKGDGVLYDSKRDCIIHQHHMEEYYTFIKIVPTTMNVCEASVMLSVARRAYDNGMRLADPDDANGGKELIKRSSREDQLNLSRGIVSNVRLLKG
jgi:hypothetical protein